MERTLKATILFCFALMLSAPLARAFIPENTDFQEAQKLVKELRQESKKALEEKNKKNSNLEITQKAAIRQNKNADKQITPRQETGSKKLFTIPYWAQLLLALLLLATLSWLLFRQQKKMQSNQGLTITELIISMGMMIVIIVAVAAIFLRGRIVMGKLDGVMDNTSSRRVVFDALSKELRQAAEDSSHSISITEGNSHLSFYKKSIDTNGNFEWIGPVELFLSGNKLVRRIGLSTYIIAEGISNLAFSYNHSIITATFNLGGNNYTIKIKPRAIE